MCHALRIAAVGFVGDPFKGQKGGRIQRIGLTLSEFLGLLIDPISNPSYSSRVCAKRALKIWNAVKLARFLKANLNPS